MNVPKIKIDPAAMKAWILSREETQLELAAQIGKGKSYFGNVIEAGSMPTLVYNLMLKVFGLPEGSFIPKPEKPESFVAPEQKIKSPLPHRDGYWLNLMYSRERVKIQLMFGDEVVIGGISKIMGDNILDFVQAISYASHMCYKFMEQKILEEKEK